jgi:XTP/dITP diphosphohydrolase
VYGRLTREPRGAGLTTAEMTPQAKDAISHRGRALRALAPVISAWLAGARL